MNLFPVLFGTTEMHESCHGIGNQELQQDDYGAATMDAIQYE